jgi:hypothetical protein
MTEAGILALTLALIVIAVLVSYAAFDVAFHVLDVIRDSLS